MPNTLKAAVSAAPATGGGGGAAGVGGGGVSGGAVSGGGGNAANAAVVLSMCAQRQRLPSTEHSNASPNTPTAGLKHASLSGAGAAGNGKAHGSGGGGGGTAPASPVAAKPRVLSRSWLDIKTDAADGKGAAAGPTFTVMQWNCLADYLAEEKSFPFVERDVLAWSYRRELLMQGVLAHVPDIICLEEVDHYSDYFLPALRALGYEGIFQKKMDATAHDGCALFWRTSRFVLVADKGLPFRTGENQVMLMAQLHPISIAAATAPNTMPAPPMPQPSGELFVVCAHFKAKPGFEEQRLQQSVAMAAHITEFVAKHAVAPHNKPRPFVATAGAATTTASPAPAVDLSQCNLLICGDFNEEWPLPPVQFFATDFVAKHGGPQPSVTAVRAGPATVVESPSAQGVASAAATTTAATATTAHAAPATTAAADAKAAAATKAAPAAAGTAAATTTTAAGATAVPAVVAVKMGGHTYTDREGLHLTSFDVPDAAWSVAHPFRLASLYEGFHPAPFWTTAKRRAVVVKRTIDYMWYAPERLRPTRLLKLPTDAQLPKLLPARDYASDHIALFGTFRYPH